MADEFYEQIDDFAQMFVDSPNSSVVSAFLDGDTSGQTTMVDLTDKGREAKTLPVGEESGMRVSFVSNLGSVMAYPTPPPSNMKGTIVMVRTSSGDTTNHGDYVFVKWDNGQFLPTHREHLQVVAGQEDNRYKRDTHPRFFTVVGSDNDLVHRSTFRQSAWRIIPWARSRVCRLENSDRPHVTTKGTTAVYSHSSTIPSKN